MKNPFFFCLVRNETEANNFLTYLNSKHPSIKFTIEIERDKKLPFLDILVSSRNGLFETSVYRKNTFSGLFMNFRSFMPSIYKLGLVNTLIDRVYKISHNSITFCFEMKKVKEFLGKNSYSPHLVEKQLKRYLHKVRLNQPRKSDENVTYMKLPYIGEYSRKVQQKIVNLCSDLTKKTNIKVVFSSNKISSFFSTKDKMPSELRARVVYKFTCAGCTACYVGETTRHYNTRVHEHLYKKSQPSSVFKHLDAKDDCRKACNENCFEIIDVDSSPYRLKVKEAIHNEWLQPNINKQKKLLKLSILI